MNLYRHYKNKPYTYVGLARHSETLEEMVIYETRYANANGKVWVRPKKMFFENVELNGKTIPRFLQVQLKITQIDHVTESEIKVIAPIIEGAFGEWDAKWFHKTFDRKEKFSLLLAYVDATAVGFKMGYENTADEYYSWLGGVLPEYRGLGIAQDLLSFQHEWCRKNGYKKISTKTQNRFKAMLLLNIENGFQIVGVDSVDPDGAKILMEKLL